MAGDVGADKDVAVVWLSKMAESLVDWGKLGAGYPGGDGGLGLGRKAGATWRNGGLVGV